MRRRFPNRWDLLGLGFIALLILWLCLSFFYPFDIVVAGRGPNGGEMLSRTWYLINEQGTTRLTGPGGEWELTFGPLLASAGLYVTLRIGLFAALNIKHPTRGVCAVCGYDLRATPARCPECGTEAPDT